MSGVAVDRGVRARACHGTDRAVIKLNAVNIDCPNTSKQRERVGAHDAQLQPAVRCQYTKIPKL